jgi:plasmid stability protein
MKTITLKNFPEDLLKQLKEKAKSNHRSLNSEIIHVLKEIYGTSRITRIELMEKGRMIRESVKQRLSDKELNEAKRDGRYDRG